MNKENKEIKENDVQEVPAEKINTVINPGEQLSEESPYNKICLDVADLKGFRKAMNVIFALMAILIALFSWMGISGAIDNQIEDRVESKLIDAVSEVIDQFNNNIEQIEDSKATVQSLAFDASKSAQESSSAASTVIAIQIQNDLLATQKAIIQEEGEWILALSSVNSLDASLTEVNRFFKRGYDCSVYKFNEVFVVAVGRLQTEEIAITTQLSVEADLNINTKIYSLYNWCRYPVFQKTGYFACYSTPQLTPTPTD